jgi:hypothetical protein
MRILQPSFLSHSSPAGVQFAILFGSLKVGAPYVLRAKLPDGYGVPPRWHPMEENVTVVSGFFRLGFRRNFDQGTLRDLPAGSYASKQPCKG